MASNAPSPTEGTQLPSRKIIHFFAKVLVTQVAGGLFRAERCSISLKLTQKKGFLLMPLTFAQGEEASFQLSVRTNVGNGNAELPLTSGST